MLDNPLGTPPNDETRSGHLGYPNNDSLGYLSQIMIKCLLLGGFSHTIKQNTLFRMTPMYFDEEGHEEIAVERGRKY